MTPVDQPRRMAWWVPALAFALLAGFLVMLWLGLQRNRQALIALGQPVGGGDGRIEHPDDVLYFQIVVAGAERPHLVALAFFGFVRNFL